MLIFKVVPILAVVFVVQGGPPEKRGVLDNNFGNFGNNLNNFGHNFGAFPTNGNGYFGNNGIGNNHGFNDLGTNNFGQDSIILTKPIVLHKVNSYPPVSPAEIASAISAAKEATSQVLQAQQRVQFAKEAVLNQQRLASQKEAQAAITAQKAEAAAAVQRQEANAAATSVVLAQQRLAQAKAEVAEHQRIAANKEAHAAQIIHRSANAAAHEIQKSENTAAKLAAFQRSEATVYKHASAAKDTTLSAASAAVAASASHYPQHPWITQALPLPIHLGHVGHWH